MSLADFTRLLRGRRMCRSYQERAVAPELLRALLEAARRSPSAGHAQGVRFGVVTGADLRKQIASCLGEARYLERGFAPWLSAAPVHLFVATEPTAYIERYAEVDKTSQPQDWPLDYAVLDGGKAMMNLYLAAASAGLACGYLGPHRAEPALQLVPWPEGWRFLGLITLGYPDWQRQRASRSHVRGWRELDTVVRWWGND